MQTPEDTAAADEADAETTMTARGWRRMTPADRSRFDDEAGEFVHDQSNIASNVPTWTQLLAEEDDWGMRAQKRPPA